MHMPTDSEAGGRAVVPRLASESFVGIGGRGGVFHSGQTRVASSKSARISVCFWLLSLAITAVLTFQITVWAYKFPLLFSSSPSSSASSGLPAAVAVAGTGRASTPAAGYSSEGPAAGSLAAQSEPVFLEPDVLATKSAGDDASEAADNAARAAEGRRSADPMLTRQLCVAAADESELCIYDGPLCYDGNDLFVVVADGTGKPTPVEPQQAPRQKAPVPVRSAADATATNGHSSSTGDASAVGLPPGQRLAYAVMDDTTEYDGGVDAYRTTGVTPGYESNARRGGPCLDWRTTETIDLCDYGGFAFRSPPPPALHCGSYGPNFTAGGLGTATYAQACADALVTTPTMGRAWGPDGKIGVMNEVERSAFVSRRHIFGLHLEDATMNRTGSVTVDEVNAFLRRGEYAPSAGKGNADEGDGDSSGGKETVFWLDGALWYTHLMSGWWDHPWHAATAVFPLWHAKRHNASVLHLPSDVVGYRAKRNVRELDPMEVQRNTRAHTVPLGVRGSKSGSGSLSTGATGSAGGDPGTASAGNGFAQTDDESDPRHSYRLTHGGAAHPPMDYLLWHESEEPGWRLRRGQGDLGGWIKGAWPMLSQPHSTLLTRPRLLEDLGLTSKGGHATWVCARSGVVTGMQGRLFAGVGDAAAFRLQAWALAGIDITKQRPYDRYPPRKITVVARTDSRALVPEQRIRSMLDATDLPWEWISDMGQLSWSQQVKAMAGTGILLGAHGAALTNLMFMPAHGVVIEAFPYIMNFPAYRRLAEVSNLYYYRLPAPRPHVNDSDTGAFEMFDEVEFLRGCEDPQRASSFDAYLQQPCNERSKNVKANVDLSLLADTLVMALDDIGCRPRQFRPAQVTAIRVAQTAVRAAAQRNVSLPSVPRPPDVSYARAEQQTGPLSVVDPYGEWDPSWQWAEGEGGVGGGAGAGSDSGGERTAANAGAPTASLRRRPPTDVWVPLQPAATNDNSSSTAQGAGVDSTPTGLQLLPGEVGPNGEISVATAAAIALAKALNVKLDQVRFVQPDASFNRFVNVAGVCTPPDAALVDKPP